MLILAATIVMLIYPLIERQFRRTVAEASERQAHATLAGVEAESLP